MVAKQGKERERSSQGTNPPSSCSYSCTERVLTCCKGSPVTNAPWCPSKPSSGQRQFAASLNSTLELLLEWNPVLLEWNPVSGDSIDCSVLRHQSSTIDMARSHQSRCLATRSTLDEPVFLSAPAPLAGRRHLSQWRSAHTPSP